MFAKYKISIPLQILLTLLLMIISTTLAFIFFKMMKLNSANISLIYILALIITAMNTSGYLYGFIFAVFSVVCVNFFFTYPFFSLNFTLNGYPVTFLIMLTISLITSTTTSHLKIQANLLAEREEIINKAEKEKMRANLLRAISHDLRTPLTSIIGSSESYLLDYNNLSNENKKDLVQRINDDAQWLLNMVENLLTVTRIQDGQYSKVNKSLEIVEEVVSEAVHRFKKRQANAIVKITIPTEILMVPMDPLLIEQVIINLLENAFFHASCTEQIQITVEDLEDNIAFHVRDFGKGIENDKLTTIFDGTGARTSELADAHRGMGIGLSICKTIIEAHNGTIFATNHVQGAEFTFQLPKEDNQ